MSTSNKRILITGAGTGIGRDAAVALAARGHIVIAATETEEQSAELKSAHPELEVITVDISKEEDRARIGSYDLDVLINNAGTGETGSLSEVPLERVRQNFEVNVFSTIAVTQIALKGMMKKGKGTVLTVSSVAGRVPSAFLNPYSMTKFALSGGMAALREEMHRVAPNVHISLIEPGAYATGFNQRMLATKYEWMDKNSYFYSLIPKLQKEENGFFAFAEQKTTKSIVKRIVSAVEATKPKLRYSSPRYQAFFVQLMRILGK